MRNSQCVIACMYKKQKKKTPSTRIPLEYTLKTFMKRHHPQPVQPGNVVFIFMHNFCKTIFYVYTYAGTVGPPGGGGWADISGWGRGVHRRVQKW